MNWTENSSHQLEGDRGPVANTLVTKSLGPKGQEIKRWFSYKTLVAFRVEGHPRVVMQNYWSNTTGKHLALIDGGDRIAKKARVSETQFAQLLEEQLGVSTATTAVVGKPADYTTRNLCLS